MERKKEIEPSSIPHPYSHMLGARNLDDAYTQVGYYIKHEMKKSPGLTRQAALSVAMTHVRNYSAALGKQIQSELDMLFDKAEADWGSSSPPARKVITSYMGGHELSDDVRITDDISVHLLCGVKRLLNGNNELSISVKDKASKTFTRIDIFIIPPEKGHFMTKARISNVSQIEEK